MSRHRKHRRIRTTNVLILFNTVLSLFLLWCIFDLYEIVLRVAETLEFFSQTLAFVTGF